MTDDIRTKSIMKNLRLLKVYKDECVPDDLIVYQRVWQYDRRTGESKKALWYKCKIGTVKHQGENIRTLTYTNSREFPPLKTIELDIRPFERSPLRRIYPLRRDSNTAFYVDKNLPEFKNDL